MLACIHRDPKRPAPEYATFHPYLAAKPPKSDISVLRQLLKPRSRASPSPS